MHDKVIKGYKDIQRISESRRSYVARAVRLIDNRSVIIKVSKSSDITNSASFQNEYDIARRIDSVYVCKYLELKQDSLSPSVIVLEDDNASDLSKIIPADGFNLLDFLNFALQITKGVQAIHMCRIIHKDIKPNNIIYCATTKSIKIIDFSSATQHRNKEPAGSSQADIGTLLYIPPEQTGRTNLTIDYRADFYSMGVTFFQLLCGKPPFVSNNPLDLIHQHIATTPQPLHHIKPTIPVIVSEIVKKLLEKDPERRYQSCQGIIYDLEFCLTALQSGQSLLEFQLGQNDVPEQFIIPEKLYGRKDQEKILHDAITNIASETKEIILVAGEAGIGKSALLDQVKKPLMLKNGLFISGKFDQYTKGIAYSAVIQAFESLIKQLFTLPVHELQSWKTAITGALGNNSHLLIHIVPSLQLLIGKQPVIQIEDPVQQKNIFIATCIKFVQLFAQPSHPLVIFLDDLQWADQASFELLTILATNPAIKCFLLLGAYRDNEVGKLHPLSCKIEELKEKSVPIRFIKLSHLDVDSVNQWVADTLRTTKEATRALAEIVFQKTLGNPFFVKSFIQALYNDNLIILSPKLGWQCDFEKIKLRFVESNVIDFLILQINNLPPKCQEILKIASCLGNIFSIQQLATALSKSPESLFQDLLIILNSGIILESDNIYHFSHDRVQEAAYSLISDAEKSELHLQIARRLYQAQPKENELQAIVGHFNNAKANITDQDERFSIAELNLRVAIQVKQATAYVDALSYLKACEYYIDLQTLWIENYSFTYRYYKELIEVEYLNGNFKASSVVIANVIPNLISVIDMAEIHNMLIIQQTMQGDYQTAFSTGDKVLKLLNSSLPLNDTEHFIEQEFINIQLRLKNVPVHSLINAQNAQSAEIKATFKILFNLFIVGYLAGSPLLFAITLMIMKLSLENGNTPESCLGYAAYGILLCAMATDYQDAYEFGKLAIQLAETFNTPAQRCRSYNIIINCVYHWSNPLHNVNPLVEIGYNDGLNVGELQYAGYILQCKARSLFYQSVPLVKLQNELEPMIKFAQETKNQVTIDLIRSVQLIVSNLRNTYKDDFNFDYDSKTEAIFLEECQKTQSHCALCLYYIMKGQVLYLYGHLQEALKYLDLAKTLLPYIPGQYALSAYNLYSSLTLIALYPQVDKDSQQIYLQIIKKNQNQMLTWSNSCKENFKHKYLLVEAELARLSSKHELASDLYDQAIDETQNQFVQELALSCELAAKHCMLRNKPLRAEGYANASYRAYRQWGATKKLMKLKHQFAALLSAFAAPNLSNFEMNSTTTLSQNSLKMLDLASILKASQDISMEVELNELLYKIMEIIIKNSGAQSGAFFLVEQDDLYIQAEYSINGKISTLQHIPLSNWSNGSHSIVNYVRRTLQYIVFSSTADSSQFKADPYVIGSSTKSALCMPVIRNNILKGILYIENNLFSNAFTSEQIQTLTILTGQMAISLENLLLIHEKFQAIQKYQERLKHFIATFSHEMRNPLSIIIANISFIADTIKSITSTSKADLTDWVDSVNNAAQIMAHIADDVLQLSKLEEGGIVLQNIPYNPKEMLHTCHKMFDLSMRRKNITCHIDYNDEDITVMGDAEKFKQIIINLLSNALKFTNAGGKITIKLSMEKLSTSETQLTITVQDDGPGIALQEQEEIFKKFTQGSLKVSSEYGGTGLGLAIARDIVKLMNGEIYVKSEPGKGAAFIFTIKCQNAPVSTSAASLTTLPQSIQATKKSRLSYKKARILIVEDNETLQMSLKRLLELADYHCEVAHNGRIAIEIMNNSSSHFDLILMDILMPELDGLEATKYIRLKEKYEGIVLGIPIIGLSANATSADREKAISAGMNAYLTKPIQKETLYSTVNTLLIEHPYSGQLSVSSQQLTTTQQPSVLATSSDLLFNRKRGRSPEAANTTNTAKNESSNNLI